MCPIFRGEMLGSNLNIPLFGYLLDFLLKRSIKLQALLESRDRRVDGRIFETAGKFHLLCPSAGVSVPEEKRCSLRLQLNTRSILSMNRSQPTRIVALTWPRERPGLFRIPVEYMH